MHIYFFLILKPINTKFFEISYLIWFVEKNKNKIKSGQESTSHSVDIKHQFEWQFKTAKDFYHPKIITP